MPEKKLSIFLAVGLVMAPILSFAEGSSLITQAQENAGICKGFGPQAPRNIDNKSGTNTRIFSIAPGYEKMNLCNIHFHINAEHKSAAYSNYAGAGDNGHGGGYQCAMGESLTDTELSGSAGDICHGMKPGDTIEVHWVYSSCNVNPGKGLGSCMSQNCANPNLRVEAQVFTLVNDSKAFQFDLFSYGGTVVDGYHQAKSLPIGTGTPVAFLGSTTGPKFTEQTCSPLQVSWSVRPECAKLDINSLGSWCSDNVFEEDHAHGVRQLVTDLSLLSRMK